MPRQLRHHRPGGWCHITARGLGRYVGMNIRAVSQSSKRMESRLKAEKGLSKAYGKALKILGEDKA